jgi:hypothetical protein
MGCVYILSNSINLKLKIFKISISVTVNLELLRFLCERGREGGRGSEGCLNALQNTIAKRLGIIVRIYLKFPENSIIINIIYKYIVFIALYMKKIKLSKILNFEIFFSGVIIDLKSQNSSVKRDKRCKTVARGPVS